MIKSAVGLSQRVQDHVSAGKEAAQEVKHKLGEEKASIVFAFASIEYDQPDVLKGIKEVFPKASVVGGSAAGEITSWATVFDGVSVMAIASDQITFTTGLGKNVLKETQGTGLGLFISRNIVEAHDGKISFSSKKGEGAEFCFSLPKLKD